MPSIEIGFNTPTLVVLLLVIAACAIAFAAYRYTLPPVPRARRLLLISLRSLGLSLLLLVLFEPLLRLIMTSVSPPTLAVLVDASKSMQIRDRQGDRAQQLFSALRGDSFRQITGNIVPRYYAFGGRTKQIPAGETDSLRLDQDATDIAAALHSLAEDRERYNIRGALLLTDGSYNLGPNPIYKAEQLGLPLFTVGIGDSSEQKDLLITKVATNDIVYSETEVPVDVTVKSSGFGGERVEVVLSEGSNELARAPLFLERGTHEYRVPLSYSPEGEGTKKYLVRVSTLEGELTQKNNRKTLFVKVLKSKLRVVIIAGSPGADLTSTAQTLREDRAIEVRSFAQRISGGFYEPEWSASTLDSADCLVLIGFPTSVSSNAVLDAVRNAVVQNNKPLFFIQGTSVDEAKLRSLSAVLPFSTASRSSAEQYVFLQPAGTQLAHPILAVGSGDLSAWDRLPPIFKTQSVYKPKSEATILGFAKIQNLITTEPLLLARSVNRQKSLALLGYGLWRWRLMAQRTTATEDLLASFLTKSIRWLTTLEDSRPVRITTTKESYTRGEPVEFMGQVYDASRNTVDNAQVRIRAQKQEDEFEVVLRSLANGRYEGVLDGLAEGDYTFHAAAELDGASLGEDRGRFTIGEQNLEFQDTRMNASLLRQLAFRTRGRYVTPADIGTIAGELASDEFRTNREVQRTREFELWNWRYTLACIVILFGGEWFLRKKSGML